MTRIATLLLLLGPSSVAAQSSISFGPFVGSNGAIAGGPSTVGLAVQPRWGVLGVRGSASMDAASSPVAPWLAARRANQASAWSGDLDLTLSPGRWTPLSPSLGRLDPALFVGVGAHGGRPYDGVAATIPSLSYGAGVSWPLFSWLSLQSEGRWRTPLGDEAGLPRGVGEGLEVRVGLTVEVGRRSGAARGVARPGAPPRPGANGRTPSSSGGTWSGDEAEARALAHRTMATAERYLGTPYVWGGNTPETGFDCSGYIRWVYAMNGIDLPRVSRDQARVGVPLPLRLDALRPGDILAFAGDGSRVDHVAIYAGDGRIVHSSKSGHGVRYDALDSRRGRWYVDHWVAARRVIGGEAAFAGLAGLRSVPLSELEGALLGEEREPLDRAPRPPRR